MEPNFKIAKIGAYRIFFDSARFGSTGEFQGWDEAPQPPVEFGHDGQFSIVAKTVFDPGSWEPTEEGMKNLAYDDGRNPASRVCYSVYEAGEYRPDARFETVAAAKEFIARRKAGQGERNALIEMWHSRIL